MTKTRDYSSIEEPLNQAAQILASKLDDFNWDRTIQIQKDLPQGGDVHVSDEIVYMTPTYATSGNPLEQIESMFGIIQSMERLEWDKHQKQIKEAKKELRYWIRLLQKKVKEGYLSHEEFQRFIEDTVGLV